MTACQKFCPFSKLPDMPQVNIDFEKEPIGISKDGKEVYFRDIWPSTEEIAEVSTAVLSASLFSYKSLLAY